MCDPISLTIAATAVAAGGQIVQGVGQAQQSRYEAQIYDRNTALDREQAQDALARGRIDEARQYRKNAQLMGAQRAAAAANGIETDFGSMGDLQGDTKRLGWEDAATIRENAIRETKGYEIQAYNSQAKAASARSAASGALIGTVFNVGSTILAGATQTSKLKAQGY